MGSDGPLLTVLVPVFNEAATIGELLKRLVGSPYEKQVIVVDDGSTDTTSEVLSQWNGAPGVTALRHAANQGKGAAIRTGLQYAEGTFCIIQDADLEYDPNDYPRLIEVLRAGEADVVFGSRYLHRGSWSWANLTCLRFGVELLNLAVGWLYGVKLTDEATCLKAFRTRSLKAMDLRSRRFEFCSEVTAKACRMGLCIKEVPVSYSPRGKREGKKLRWTDGFSALTTLWRFRKWRSPAVVS